jgi:hypothetical protein
MNRMDQPDDMRGMRERSLARARILAAGLTVIAGAAALASLFGPQPNDTLLAMLVAVPLLSIIFVIAWRSQFRIGLGTGSAQANLASAGAVAAGGLFLRTLVDFNPVSWLPLSAFAAAVGIVFLVAAVRRETNLRRRWWRLIAAGVVVGAYAFGLLGQFNQRLDRSPQSVLRSYVLDKHRGRSRIASYHVTLAPWGPFGAPNDASVPQELYDRLQVGDSACLRLNDGAFGMAWFTVAACR